MLIFLGVHLRNAIAASSSVFEIFRIRKYLLPTGCVKNLNQIWMEETKHTLSVILLPFSFFIAYIQKVSI